MDMAVSSAIKTERPSAASPGAPAPRCLRMGEVPKLFPLRTIKEYNEAVESIHLNPVRRGLVRRAEDWEWSSAHEYAARSAEEPERRCGLSIDHGRLPADESTAI